LLGEIGLRLGRGLRRLRLVGLRLGQRIGAVLASSAA
jgi:hypothetical protein